MTTQTRFSLRAVVAAAMIAFTATASLAQLAQGASHTDVDPGWTGRTMIPGSTSSLADTASSTREHQTGQY